MESVHKLSKCIRVRELTWSFINASWLDQPWLHKPFSWYADRYTRLCFSVQDAQFNGLTGVIRDSFPLELFFITSQGGQHPWWDVFFLRLKQYRVIDGMAVVVTLLPTKTVRLDNTHNYWPWLKFKALSWDFFPLCLHCVCQIRVHVAQVDLCSPITVTRELIQLLGPLRTGCHGFAHFLILHGAKKNASHGRRIFYSFELRNVWRHQRRWKLTSLWSARLGTGLDVMANFRCVSGSPSKILARMLGLLLYCSKTNAVTIRKTPTKRRDKQGAIYTTRNAVLCSPVF